MSYPILTPVPAYCRRALIFDVETTGLIPKPNPAMATPPRLDECPYIIQLSFVIFNIVSNRVEEAVNAYISIPEEIPISDYITSLTGISRDVIREKGEPIVPVLERFYEAYLKCDMVVAHNLEFDKTMIHIEIARNETRPRESPTGCAICVRTSECDIGACSGSRIHRRGFILVGESSMRALFTPEFNTSHSIDLYCTMLASVDLCNIVAEYIPPTPELLPNNTNASSVFKKPRAPVQYKKFPRLSELHNTLFGYAPENLHNALIDVAVCLRCFMKIRCCVDLSDTSFDRMVRNMVRLAGGKANH
jgi:DNA polymerase III epsilon subunit-like protein